MKKLIAVHTLVASASTAFASNGSETKLSCQIYGQGTRLEQIEKVAGTMVALQQQNQVIISKMSDMKHDEKFRAEITLSENNSNWIKCNSQLASFFE